MGGKKVETKIIGTVDLEVQLGKEYSILKALDDCAWISSNVEVLDDNKIRLSMAFGQTVRQGKIVAPFDTDIRSDLIVSDTGDDNGNVKVD
ncbi:MAG: hypothetical protein E7440_01825 [Ruminococcaceae bacterium]|nr:hypothetical protein [Oscillospiraceae bacterium]